MTALTLSRDNARGAYTLTGPGGTVLGSLAVDRRLRHGEAITAAGSIAVHSSGLRRRSACAGDERAPVLRLDTAAAVVPGLSGARWDVTRDRSRFVGTLSGTEAGTGAGTKAGTKAGTGACTEAGAGDGGGAGVRIVVVAPAGGTGPLQVDVVGDWPDRDLAVLTAAFALLARRHGDTMLTAALVSVATGGAGR